MRPAIVALALSGGSAVSVGFARFGYALILPAMQADLQLNYAQAGWLNTANSLGYLLGALLVIYFVASLGNRRLFMWGMALTTLSLLACGLTHNFLWLSIFRFLAGFGGAGTFICGGVLAGVIGTRAIVIFFSGGGLGMLLTGVALPWMFELQGAVAWPMAWLAMGILCIPLSIAAIRAAHTIAEPSSTQASASWPWRRCMPVLISYFMFGLGYIAYMTFMVAWVKHHAGDTSRLASTTSVMWGLLGIMTLLAPLIWARLFNGRQDGRPMGMALFVLTTGAGLPLILPDLAGIWLSAALVGASVFMVPSAVTGFVKSNLARPAWGNAMAIATSLFAIGQTIGPAACGWISDMAGSLSFGLAISAMMLLLAGLLALLQKPVATTS
ncbi:YbfB/YjiJ family MFS transporter [Pollutimonas harenae]|uniref:YbfB/YjiJ family MFS transporter n=1 Tax=Pollutimonas harenae TaxID=657015 RepID=A0A853GZI0_9BURK|nr:YbfB/YjiJ family MFS transporter [Pollutimonas harenae]NYT85170.1 YbfB/YjiJ family MFS transporter [Pollutimonas harenae]TEA72452.1 YbfB/YjiJ family MFS transporter [Pollutimonas harenae]